MGKGQFFRDFFDGESGFGNGGLDGRRLVFFEGIEFYVEKKLEDWEWSLRWVLGLVLLVDGLEIWLCWWMDNGVGFG